MRPSESFIQQPVRSLQYMLRVISKDDSRFPTVVLDGIYGPDTMNAVMAFQRQFGLPITGVTNQATWEKIVDAYELAIVRIGKAEPIEIIIDPGQVFRYGDSSPYIYLLQSMLTDLSKNHNAIRKPQHTGILDTATSEALSAFQHLAGLPITGELDKITWKHVVRQFTLNAHHNTVYTAQTPSCFININNI